MMMCDSVLVGVAITGCMDNAALCVVSGGVPFDVTRGGVE